MIGWVDVETTGLTAADVPLEAAVVITDDDLNELDAVEILMLPDVDRDHRWDWLDRIREQPEVLAMHTKSGLIAALLVPEAAQSTRSADRHLGSWLGSAHGNQTITAPSQLVLAGASVGFDRKMMERHLPSTASWFHYRQIDVSSIKELAKRWAPDLAGEVASDERPHRALADIRESIDLLRRYRAAGFIGGPGHAPILIGEPPVRALLHQMADDIVAGAEGMDRECKNQPCQHAVGMRFAASIVRDGADG